MSTINNDKLSKLQAQAASAGGPRRKIKKAHKTTVQDDKKLQASLKKLTVQSVPGIEEVNMFHDNGNVIHFQAPKVQAAINANTFVISGEGEEKDLSELIPGILNQLGPDSIASLRKIAEAYQAQAGGHAAEEVPDLVDNFEAATLEDEKATA